jgi:hypothetical protein
MKFTQVNLLFYLDVRSYFLLTSLYQTTLRLKKKNLFGNVGKKYMYGLNIMGRRQSFIAFYVF